MAVFVQAVKDSMDLKNDYGQEFPWYFFLNDLKLKFIAKDSADRDAFIFSVCAAVGRTTARWKHTDPMLDALIKHEFYTSTNIAG